MKRSVVVVMIVAAALVGNGRSRTAGAPFRKRCRSDSARADRRIGCCKVAATGHCAGQAVLRRGFRPPGLSGRDRHAAHGRRGAAIPQRQRPRQTPQAGRSPAGKRRVRRLLDDEVVRPAAGQVGIPHQPVAQCRAGLPSLDSHVRQGEHAVRPIRPGDAHRQRQQLPQAAGELLSRGSEPRAAGHRAGRGADFHGRAAGRAGPRSGGRAWRPSSRRSPSSRPANGRRRSSCSISKGQPRKRPPRRCRRPRFPTERRPNCRRARIPARPLPIGCWPPRIPGLRGTWPTASGSGCWAAASFDPPDDIRPDNPPANPELLAFLEQELVASGYDVKHLCRLILNSATYQRSHISPTEDSRGEANFACYPLRRLEAEVLIDALCQITGTTEQYSSIIPEPSPSCPRSSERWPWPTPASPARSWRNSAGRRATRGWSRTATIAPRRRSGCTMLNSSHIRRKIETSPKLQPLLQSIATSEQRRRIVAELYLTILSRFPTDEELQIAEDISRRPARGRGTVLTRPGLGAGQQPGVFLSALQRGRNHEHEHPHGFYGYR